MTTPYTLKHLPWLYRQWVDMLVLYHQGTWEGEQQERCALVLRGLKMHIDELMAQIHLAEETPHDHP